MERMVADLESRDSDRRAAAAEWISHQPDASAEALCVLDALGDSDERVREWITATLEEIEKPLESIVAPLAERLEHDNSDVAYWAATLLGRIGPAAGAARAALANLLDIDETDLSTRERAAWALGKIGMAGAQETAKAALERATQSPHSRLATTAKRALS